MNILELAKRNQQKAWEIIEDTRIVRIWEGIGAKVNLVGSLRTGLLMKHRDIDFHIYTSPLDLSASFRVRKLGVKNLKIYLNGNNLWVWSKMPDDRESNFAGSGNQGAYPTVKRFNLGVKFTL